MGQSTSTSFQLTETNTAVDSYNKTYNSTSNISDAGNVAINLPSVGGGGGGAGALPLIMGLVAAGLLFVFILFRKG